jgi:cytochrome c peroxidase
MTAVQRVLPRHSFRAYATESTTPPPPPKSSNTGLFVGVGLLAAGGAAYWFYASDSDSSKQAGTAIKSGVQVAKAATNFVPTKADYQKVYNRIAETLEDENHDGEPLSRYLGRRRQATDHGDRYL